MDLTLSPQEEAFRDELREWLAAKRQTNDIMETTGYVVYRDGIPLTSMSSSVTSFTDNACATIARTTGLMP